MKINQFGALNLFLILILLFGFGLGSWIFFQKPSWFQNQKPQTSSTPTQTKPVVDKQNLQSDDLKKDPEWLGKYCKSELSKIPEAPFQFTKKTDIVYTLGSVNILDRFPKEKRYEGKSCVLDYKFEDKPAYASVGVKYVFDINYRNKFEEKVDNLITSKMDSSWKKISPLSNEEGGRPFYGYKGFPLIFSRENSATGTQDFVYFNWGAKSLYVTFSTYEK